MAGLTKTQINYLENKLSRVVEDKVEKFRKELGDNKSSDKVLVEKIIAGEIKLLSTQELIEKLKEKNTNSSYYYSQSIYVNEMVSTEDRERVENEVSERDKKVNDFREKLYNAKQNALDKIVLDGIDVETAMAELNSIQ
jgi:hypothetical protein